jgi:hypothetical protein
MVIDKEGNILFTSAVTASIFTGSFTGSFQPTNHFIPDSNETYDLGSNTNRWRDLYLSGSTIYLDDVALSKNTDGDLEVKDGNGNFKSIRADEVIIGTGDNATRLKINNGRLSAINKNDSRDESIESAISASFAETSSLSVSSSYAITASHALNVPDTASHALTAVTASYTAGTASFANSATTASYTSTGDGVFSGSFSGSFVGDASNLNVNPFPFTGSGEMQGKLTVESFQDYVDEDYVESYFAGTAIASSGDIALTGSIFSTYINADQFTGSFSGSLSGSFTGSFGGTADSASHAETASYFSGTVTSASLAETASFYGGTVTSASFAETSSYSHIASQSVNNNTASGSLSFWQGSQAEYDLISASADDNTIYFVV